MAHWREYPDTLAPVMAAVQATRELPPDLARVYFHLAVTVLDRRGRDTWRTLMATQTPFISQLGLELIEEGRCEGLREALRRFLAARHIELTAAQQTLIDTCADASLLDEWIAHAATATSADAVFRSP
jgi:hypothetical protein